MLKNGVGGKAIHNWSQFLEVEFQPLNAFIVSKSKGLPPGQISKVTKQELRN